VSHPSSHKVADNWQPWRTVATWYLWRSLDPLPVDY
jgi:DNA-3-methyladenine glycosylase II